MPTAPSPTQPKESDAAWKGFSLAELEQFGIKQSSDGSIWLPYYKRDGSLFRAKRFTSDGRSWWIKGQGKGQIPYGVEQLKRGGKVLVLAEGESDTLALRLAWPSIVAIGIPGASSWKSEWKRIAEGFERVYLSFDSDDAGERLTLRVKRDLAQAQRLNLPPGSDTRDVLQRLGKPAFRALFEAADASARFESAIRDEWKVHDLYKKRAAA